jgi:hypothetical protein
MPPRGAAARAGLVVAAVVAFNAWYLRSELDPVHYLNDASFHLAYLGWARDRLTAGDSPLDGIFTPLGLGFPLFQHYQVLPYLLTAPLAALFGVQHTSSWCCTCSSSSGRCACTCPSAGWASPGAWRRVRPWRRRSS